MTIRKPRSPEKLPRLVHKVIRTWVSGQSYRWTGIMFHLDEETVARWIKKHPDIVQAVANEEGYGAYTSAGLWRKFAALQALGISVSPPGSRSWRPRIF